MDYLLRLGLVFFNLLRWDTQMKLSLGEIFLCWIRLQTVLYISLFSWRWFILVLCSQRLRLLFAVAIFFYFLFWSVVWHPQGLNEWLSLNFIFKWLILLLLLNRKGTALVDEWSIILASLHYDLFRIAFRCIFLWLFPIFSIFIRCPLLTWMLWIQAHLSLNNDHCADIVVVCVALRRRYIILSL